MRNTLKILVAIVVLPLMAVSCDEEQKEIKDVAYKYLDAMGNYRISEARAFATKATRDNTLTFIEESIMPYMDSSYITKNTPAKIKIKGVRVIDKDHVRVAFQKTTPIKTQNDSITIVKVGRVWRVDQVISAPGGNQPILQKRTAGSDTTAVKRKKRISEIDPAEVEKARKEYQKSKK